MGAEGIINIRPVMAWVTKNLFIFPSRLILLPLVKKKYIG